MSKKIFVAGHNGMVGRALLKAVSDDDIEIITHSRSALDLTRQSDVENFFTTNNIDEVYVASARVGGILENKTYMADFTYTNAIMELNIIKSAYEAGVENLLFLGSSCIYPKFAEIPIKEEALLGGYLEETNEGYALAKILGVKYCQYLCEENSNLKYRTVIPTNLYGPYDNFNTSSGHVLPSLIYKFHEAKTNKLDKVVVWGDGTPTREFLHIDDLAQACKLIVSQDELSYSWFNIGSGQEVTIKDLALIISEVVNFEGEIVFDKSMPNGTPRKLIDSSRLRGLGWEPKIELSDGIENTYKWFCKNFSTIKK